MKYKNNTDKHINHFNAYVTQVCKFNQFETNQVHSAEFWVIIFRKS